MINQRLLKSWPFGLGLLLGLCFVTMAILGWDFSFFPGDLGDARFNAYILEHGHKYLTGQVDSLWNAPFMYPEKNVVTYSDNLIGTVPIYSIFRILGFSVLSAFQAWFVIISILNYTCAYYFLKWLFKHRHAAVIGAFIFAFSIALQSQMTHAQVFPRFWIPLALLLVLKFKETLDPKYFFWAVFSLVAQFYAGIYLGFMLAIPFSILFISILFVQRKQFLQQVRSIKWSSLMLIAVLLNVALLLILMYPYYLRSLEVGNNDYGAVINSIPTIRSFFYSQHGSLLWDRLSQVGSMYPAAWDHQIFPGAIALLSLGALVVIILLRKRYFSALTLKWTNVILLTIAALGTFIFFTRFQGFSFYKIIFNLPGFGSMRSLTRIINIELIFFGIAVSFIAYLLMEKWKKQASIVFLIFFAFVFIDNYFNPAHTYKTEKSVAQKRVDDLCLKMSEIPEGSVVSYEPKQDGSSPAFAYQIDAMLATQQLNLKAVNGYSGNSPLGYHLYWWDMNEETRLFWFNTIGYTPQQLYIIE